MDQLGMGLSFGVTDGKQRRSGKLEAMQKMKKGLIIGDGGNEEIQQSIHAAWDLMEVVRVVFCQECEVRQDACANAVFIYSDKVHIQDAKTKQKLKPKEHELGAKQNT